LRRDPADISPCKNVLFAFLLTACAATTLPAPAVEAAEAGTVYLGVDGAYASGIQRDPYTKSFRVTSETNTIGAVRLLAGYQLTPNIGLEVGYVRRTDYRQSAVNGPFSYDATARTTNRISLWSINSPNGCPVCS